jgi:hypothetical protein
MVDSIHIIIDDDTERLLKSLKEDYPTLDAAELFKLGLFELSRKQELEQRKRWAESLPTLELSDEEQAELAEALAEADREPGRIMTVDELIEEALRD